MLTNIIKPEIGAPGASISAVAGGGTATEPFSGTSGAAPMVTGSAALLNEAFTNRSNAEIKAVLMNTAETEIFNSLAAFGGDLAAISRIGGGEVRVDRALNSPTAAWDKETLQGALSFGQLDVTDDVVELTRTITVRNYTGRAVPYRVSAEFRFADDADGAVSLSVSKNVTVPPRRTVDVPITLRIDGPQLEQWVMNSGLDGANPASLTSMEFDGYIRFDNKSTKADDDDPMHVAWHVLPRKSGDVSSSASTMAPDGSVTLTNNAAAGTAQIDAYSLLGTSPDLPEGPVGGQAPVVDIKSIGVQTIPVEAGFCSADESFLLLLAVNTWERQTHANAPASFEWQLSTDADPQPEFFVFNLDAALNLSDGRNLTFVQRAGSTAGAGVLRHRSRNQFREHGADDLRRADRHERGGLRNPDHGGRAGRGFVLHRQRHRRDRRRAVRAARRALPRGLRGRDRRDRHRAGSLEGDDGARLRRGSDESERDRAAPPQRREPLRHDVQWRSAAGE